ncbi:MAG TPA: Flp pilus assembly protein CpaB [Acetobacteraceae bacterium]|nr:Flp pilus assembly protein CpaB [Acetobacteraceae bacterium]
MIVRVAFFILMSLGLIGFGTVAWITTRPMGLGGPPPTKMILVAAVQIDAGSLVTADDLQQKEIPVTEMTKEYNIDTPDIRRGLMGAMVKRNLGVGEAIRSDDIMRPSDHGFMAAVLSPGMRAVTINVDAASGSSGLIWPGDRVDLILTQVNNDPNASIGRRISAHTVLSNVRVVAVDSQLVAGPNRNAAAIVDAANRTVTLEVDEDQAQRVAVGMRLGRLSVSVRASSTVAGNAKTPTKNDATFAQDILPDLVEKPAAAPVAPVIVAAPPPAPVEPPMRVFSGPGDAKEFKF